MKKDGKERYYHIRKEWFWGIIAIYVCFSVAILMIIFRPKQEEIGLDKKICTEYGHISSELDNLKECYLCGSSDASMMDYYRKFDTIGIIGLNQWEIIDLRLKEYDSEGNYVEKEGTTSCQSSMQGVESDIDATPSRGMARATIKTSDGMFCETIVRKHLCQNCLDKVVSTLERETENGAKEFLPFCVVDFKTLELYPVQKTEHSYFVRDYWVQIESSNDSADIEVYYLPKN